MRRTARSVLLVGTALVALTVAALAGAATKTVDITRLGFGPDKVTIDLGDSVTWTNKDTSQHQVVADQSKFPASPVLQAGQSYSYTFVKSGAFGYRDAFNTKERGTITVREGVTLAAAPAPVAYGGSTTLSGIVSNAQSGERVTVNAQLCGTTAFAKLGTATSGANGAWSFVVKPTISTVYEARWKTNSRQLAVKVGPKVRLAKLGRGRFAASVVAGQTFVGKYVVLKRYSSAKRAWLTVKRVTLRTAKAGAPPTMTSAAGFRARVRRGTKLRLELPQSQAGACYLAARSGTVRA